MYTLGFKNTSTQTVEADGPINLGVVYRRNSYKDNCGRCAFQLNSQVLSLLQAGMYELIISFVVSAPAAGDVTIQLFENGEAVTGALATETITTATTEFHTMTIPYVFLVDKNCVLGRVSTGELQITAVNVGDAPITIINIAGTLKKVVY
jgi:hypothetical protein